MVIHYYNLPFVLIFKLNLNFLKKDWFSFTLNLGPEGTGSGAYKLSGSGIVTEKTITAAHDGLVEMTIGFQGTGALTIGTY